MISTNDFYYFIRQLGDTALDDIEWAESRSLPASAVDFAEEVIFVICNSGMKHTVAVGIYQRVIGQIRAGEPVSNVFRHAGKAAAIETIWAGRENLFAGYIAAEDKVSFARSIPWIGSITAYHVVKNFGAQVAKPDVHLQRLADREGCTAQQLCERLSAETAYKVATVDTILWRACATGWLNSKTGLIRL